MADAKRCTKCGVVKALEEFSRVTANASGYHTICKLCAYASPELREAKRLSDIQRRDAAKAAVIEAYGGSCRCCGETEPRFLTIDHIYNDGAECRRNGELGGTKLYIQLRKRGFPTDRYQLLCFNCNCAKRIGPCPHQLSKHSAVATTATHIN